ncbi:bis(5'-nucleosyl)-tetraphosphatase [Patescibacteria group bacterium]
MITYEKSAGAVIYREENGETFYLLMKYRNFHWDFAKGHMEKGETLKETALREAEEETGISDLEIKKGFKKNIYYCYRAKGNEREERKRDGRGINIVKRVVFFLAETKTKEVELSHEQIAYLWLKYDEAVEKVTYENAKKMIRAANEYLKKNAR